MQSAEIELKFPVVDPAELEGRLPGLGFALETPRTFEHNTLYDTPERSLRERHQLLRIRRYGDIWTLTHKRQPDGADDRVYKTRIETESRLEDGDALAAVFEQLGYLPAFTYEKFRSEWRYALTNISAHLVVDETPIGNWAELEGPTEWIDAMLVALEVDPATCLTDSYGKLFSSWKERTAHPANDLTFDQIAPALTNV